MAEQPRPQLVRDLGLFDVTMVGVGAMIGAGIFVLTGIAAGEAGPALILAFALNGVLTIFTAMVYAELGSAIPEAGGGYLWVKEGLPAWNAFLAGWMSWFAHAVAGSLYALGFGAYCHLIVREFDLPTFGLSDGVTKKLLAVLVVLLFTGVNFKGVSETGKVGNAITVGKIAILAVFVISGMLAIYRNPQFMDKFTPFAPEGMPGILTAMGLTFIAFEGYEIIVQAGEEVKDPRRNIPRAVFLSLAIVIPIYILVAFAAIGAVTPDSGLPTWQWLGGQKELGLAEAARQFMPLGTFLLLVGGLFSTMSALNATTFSSTRVAFAMGRDRNLPDAFGRIHGKTNTPFLSLLFSGGLILFVALAMPIDAVAAAADVMFLLLFLQVNAAAITIRKKYGDKLDYGFLTPFFPVMPVLAIVSMLFLAVFMFHFSVTAWLFVLGWIGGGFGIYYFYASRREREKEVTPVMLHKRPAGAGERFRVLAAIANPRSAETVIRVGSRIARAGDGQLLLLHVATVPRQTPLRGNRRLMDAMRPAIENAESLAEAQGTEYETMVRVGHIAWKGIVNTVEETHVNFLVMGWRGRSRHPRTQIGRNIDQVVKRAPCNVLVVQQNAAIPAKRILVPVAHPGNVPLLVGMAQLLLDEQAPDREIRVIHVVRKPHGQRAESHEERPDAHEERPVGPSREKSMQQLQEALQKPAFFETEETKAPLQEKHVSFEQIEADSVVKTIVERTKTADLAILGSSQQGWLHRTIFGEIGHQVARLASCPVALLNQETHAVQFGIQSFFQFFRELREEPPQQ